MSDSASTPLLVKISFIAAPVGCLLQVIGVATAYWKNSFHGLSDPGSLVSEAVDKLSSSVVELFSGSSGKNHPDVSNTFNSGLSNSGLWSSWTNDKCSCVTVTGSLGAVRAFAILAILAAAGATLLIGTYCFIGSLRNKIVHILALVMAGGAAFCILLSVSIYGREAIGLAGLAGLAFTVSWSFALCVVAMFIEGFAAVFLLISLLQKRSSA